MCLSSGEGWRNWERLQGRADDGARCHSHARSRSLRATRPPVSLSPMTTFIMYSGGIISPFLPPLPPSRTFIIIYLIMRAGWMERDWETEGMHVRWQSTASWDYASPLMFFSDGRWDSISLLCIHPSFVIFPPPGFSLLYSPAWSWPIICGTAAGCTCITLST